MSSPDEGQQPPTTASLVRRHRLSWIYKVSVVAALGVLTVWLAAMAVYAVRQTIILAAVAMFVAVSLDPAVRWLIRHRFRRAWAVTLVMFVVLTMAALFVATALPPITSQATQLTEHIPDYLKRLETGSRSVRELGARWHLTDRLTALAATLPERVGTSALRYLQQFLGVLFSALLVLVLTIYFMADLPRLRRALVSLFPADKRPAAARATDVVVDKVGDYMIGNLLISLVAGIASLAVFLAVGVPYALPLAVLVAVTDLIPMVGATIGAVVCTVIAALAVDVWPAGVVVGLFFVGYQQLENYLIAPRIMRNTVDLPSVAVLLASLVGATLLGLVGALMAIPITAAVRVLLTELRDPGSVQEETADSPTDGGDTAPAAV